MYLGSAHIFLKNDTWSPRWIVSPRPRKNFFYQSRTPLNRALTMRKRRRDQEPRRRRSHTNVHGNLLYVPGKRRWALSESTKGNVAARGSTMKDGCEYVSGIENTWEEFGRFILLNFNFLFLLLRLYSWIRLLSKNCDQFSQRKIEKLEGE